MRGKNVSKMKKKRERVHSIYFKKIICSCGVAVALLFISASVFVLHSSAKTQKQYDKCYTSIEVCQGDSLWSIASKHCVPECSNIDNYIDEVKRINHIQGEKIVVGDYLTIPYYSVSKR